MRVSVLLSTYNQPVWLEKTLWGYAAQSHSAFEIVIADDGSTDVTRRLIERVGRETGLAIRHVWHEDRGFRKCTILNRAIEAAAGDYLIFSDGDCIPRGDFVARHVALAAPRQFLSGGYFKLPLQLSHDLTRQDIADGHATDPAWLRRHGVALNQRLWKLCAGARWAGWLDAWTPTGATWNGHNASTWKNALLEVNGFDERMEWGGEDRELGERLVHAGYRGRRVRFRAVCVHLEHARGYVREEALLRNRAIRAETRRTRAAWTAFGIRSEGAERSEAESVGRPAA